MTENLLVSLNDIEEKEASWLVPQRMPKGQIIILAGDGGSGKTSCWCSLEAYCKRAIASRSSFCVRAVQNIAKKSEIRLTVPTEDAAIRVIDEANNRLKEIVHIYDGKFLFGDRNKNQSLIMDAHGYEDSGFLGRLEKEYQAATLEDIKISRMSRKEFDTKNAVTRVDEMKKPVELVEVGEDIGIRAKDDVSSSLAARYAKAYSERMSTVNPEFE